MGLILFQLFYSFTIGSLVYWDNALHRIEEITFIHPFMRTKSIIFRSTIRKPFWWVITIRNQYGGTNIIGNKVLKHPYKMKGFTYHNIPEGLK